PTGLELYFDALGATAPEMKQIRTTLQRELDRRVAASSQQVALRAFNENELEGMPYSQALAEVEAVTRFEESISAPIAHVAPLHDLPGPDAAPEANADPRRWGLLHHLEALYAYLQDLELRMQDDLAAIPRRSTTARQIQAAADVREMMSAYAHWLEF